MGTNAELHDQDFYAWLEDTAGLLRAGKWHDIDTTTLAEEIDAVRSQERREALRRLRRLIQHLLKWQYQPARRQTGHSWRSTIRTQRAALADMLEESPSMARELPTLLMKDYPLARQWASDDTHLRPSPPFRSSPPGPCSRCSRRTSGRRESRNKGRELFMAHHTSKAPYQCDPVVQEFAAMLRQRLGLHLRQLLLFGSRARGDAQDGSDYDMLVVVDHRTPELRAVILEVESQLMERYGALVATVLRSETEWQQLQELPLAHNIAREGVRL